MLIAALMWAAAIASPISSQSSKPVPDATLPNAKLVGMKFTSGDLDGLSVSWRVDSEGMTFVGLAPSKPNASPLPKEIVPLVLGLVDAYQKGETAKYGHFVGPDTKTYISCLYCGQGLPFVEHDFRVSREEKLTLNTPYLLKHGALADFDYQVRLEWLHDGQLYYASVLVIDEGKVRDVFTYLPRIPPIAPPPSEKAEGPKSEPIPKPNTTGPAMTAWASCMSNFAGSHLKGKTTDQIVDEGFVACSSDENAVKAAYNHDLGADGGAIFAGIKQNVRGIMLKRVAEAKRLHGVP